MKRWIKGLSIFYCTRRGSKVRERKEDLNLARSIIEIEKKDLHGHCIANSIQDS
jgi:hypothetical protein